MAEQYEYAGILSRFLALFIDGIILMLIILPLMFLGALATIGIAFTSGPAALSGFILLWLLSVLISVLYFTILEGRNGQTIGKMALSIKVVGYDGKPIGMTRAFIRNLLRIIDGFFFYLIGAILILVSERKQRLGDMAARDVVISLKKPGKFTPEKEK